MMLLLQYDASLLRHHCDVVGRYIAYSMPFQMIYYSIWFLKQIFPTSTLTLSPKNEGQTFGQPRYSCHKV